MFHSASFRGVSMAHGDMLESSISRGTEGTAGQRGFSLADLPAKVCPSS